MRARAYLHRLWRVESAGRSFLASALLLATLSCSHAVTVSPPQPRAQSALWSIDLVRTKPGMQADYLRTIAANWGGSRDLVRRRGAVRSYMALGAAPDSARGWDVILMTEYPDSSAFANREVIFREVFASPEFAAITVSIGRASSDLRTLVASEVVMRTIVRSDP